MDIHDIAKARARFQIVNGRRPKVLNVSVADAMKLLMSLTGNGSLSRDIQDRATEALSLGEEAVIAFFRNSEILGMRVKLIPVVE